MLQSVVVHLTSFAENALRQRNVTLAVPSQNVDVLAVISDKYTTFYTFWARLLAENS